MQVLLFQHRLQQYGHERWNYSAVKAAGFSSMKKKARDDGHYGAMLEWYRGHKDIRYQFN
jgi:hypothetical protein